MADHEDEHFRKELCFLPYKAEDTLSSEASSFFVLLSEQRNKFY
jgi:hypothetical protein